MIWPAHGPGHRRVPRTPVEQPSSSSRRFADQARSNIALARALERRPQTRTRRVRRRPRIEGSKTKPEATKLVAVLPRADGPERVFPEDLTSDSSTPSGAASAGRPGCPAFASTTAVHAPPRHHGRRGPTHRWTAAQTPTARHHGGKCSPCRQALGRGSRTCWVRYCDVDRV